MEKDKNRYELILDAIFRKYYQPGFTEISFERADIARVATELGIGLPKNLGDIMYSFRYRAQLPESITRETPESYEWIIRPAGKGLYKLALVAQSSIVPSPNLVETKIPNATPGVIDKYSLNDEQALLARLRYNRLIDIFTGLTCYSLQNHLRTTVSSMGQVEIDEIYIGIDKRGAHYILPIQAKGQREKIGVVQIEQDFEVCKAKFPNLICRSIAAQFMNDDLIVLFELEQTDQGIKVSSEKHYRLVQPADVTSDDLEIYKRRPIFS
jgi:hypothetical protein